MTTKGSWTPEEWGSYSSSHISGKSTAAIYTSSNLKDEFNPLKMKNGMRESCDSDKFPNSTPIIIGLDVTGSMGRILNAVAQKLGVLVGEIYNRKTILDPQVLFAAIGDARAHDEAPFQATQFETDIKIAEQLRQLWFEGMGGGNCFESYPLAWYFAVYHTKIDSFDKHGRKGFLFTMGDDGFPGVITREEVKRVFGDDIQADIPVKELLAQVNRKYEVFHLCLEEGGTYRDSDFKEWRKLLGERAVKVSDYTRIPEIIISWLEVMAGKDAADVINSWDGSTGLVVKEALGSRAISKANSNGLVEF